MPRLAFSKSLKQIQSALTGESLPVDKKVGDTAYSGTTVKLGDMVGEVTAIGLETFFGKNDFIGIGWAYVGWSWLYIAAWFLICLGTKIALYHFINFEKGKHAHFLKKN